MKIKRIIALFLIFILIMTGLLVLFRETIKISKPSEPVNREISFGVDCETDEDCTDSVLTCKDGFDVHCTNGCVYGICTKCLPVCPGESSCGNTTCSDSVLICPDGRMARCTNYCDIKTGECSSCTPKCELTVTDKVNYRSRSGKYVLDAIPCINATYTERVDIKSTDNNLSKIDIPEGYSIIINPFSVMCDGSTDLTLSIPETFTDIKALRCKGQYCNPVVTRYVTELRCGGEVTEEFFKGEEYLEPKFMPVKIKETSHQVAAKTEIVSDQYKVKFEGNDNTLTVSLSMPLEPVEEPKNPTLKIAGTPLIVTVKGIVGKGVNATVTMPYTNLELYDENSVGMFVKSLNGWKYIGGVINKNNHTVTATLSDLNSYLDNKNEMMLALMEVLCVSCYGSSLNLVYQPEEGSKTAVILLHGFAPKPNTFKKLIDDMKLTNQPFDVWTFDYSSSKPINETVKELIVLLEKNQAAYDNIYVVAHSLGGLIIQEALYQSYEENKKSLENRMLPPYNYINKVKKVILIATPNEGSPLLGVYRNFFDNLINDEDQSLFNPNSEVMGDLIKGKITPRVPGVDYYVIAGSKPYEFNLLFFKVSSEELVSNYEKNDGIITVSSAQHVGDGYINNQCDNYWELNLSHTELIENPLARKVIGQILSKEISTKNSGLLGYNKYFDLSINDCSLTDNYIIIGKEIKEEEVLDPTGCSCGNGYCGEGEDELSCPSDCANFLPSKERNNLLYVIISGIISFILCFQYITYRARNKPHIRRLIEHIKKNYEIFPGKGYTARELREAFLRKGWPKSVVDASFKRLGKEFNQVYHKPLMDHVTKHLKKGYTEAQIRRALMSYGWPKEPLDMVFRGNILEPGYTYKRKWKFLEPMKSDAAEKSYFGVIK
jgi:pimeloyl-ACP methyl ester carboxylesterase